MRFIIVLLSGLIIGQMIGYLGAALSHTAYTPMSALIGSLILVVIVYIIGELTSSNKQVK